MQPMISTIQGSSNITEIAWYPATKTLRITFNNGGIYAYGDVPIELHDELLAAPSKGSFIHQRIKGKFTCVNLTPLEEVKKP